jgi:eIF-2B alpha/beta/delta-like uncharacterized protein
MVTNINKVVKDIKSIKIQGATNITKASIGALFDFSKSFNERMKLRVSSVEPHIFSKEAEKIANQLAWARPDEPLSQNFLALIIAKIKNDKSGELKEKIANFRNYCNEALELILKNEDLITANGIKLVKKIYNKKIQSDNVIPIRQLAERNPSRMREIAHSRGILRANALRMTDAKKHINIFTHCNSSSVFKIIFGSHKAGIPVKVYDSETRPRYQGRIMAKNLAKNGIDVTMMTDSAAPFVISKNDPDRIDIDLVIIGADVVGLDGAVLNKIGSYSLAMAAKNAGVPFYVATSLLKVRKDIGTYREIKIEKRDPTELWQKSLKGIKAINYAFDTVPPKYISGFITEFGVLKSRDVKKTAMKRYKEIFKK